MNIQQNTEGFTYSQAAGGHTIFSVSAANAIRYKQGGRAELHKVKILSYGRQSDRLDEISGDDFEYDAQSGDINRAQAAIDEAKRRHPEEASRLDQLMAHLRTPQQAPPSAPAPSEGVHITLNCDSKAAYPPSAVIFVIARAAGGKYGGALMTTIDSIDAGRSVAIWSSTMPPPLRPIALTRAIPR